MRENSELVFIEWLCAEYGEEYAIWLHHALLKTYSPTLYKDFIEGSGNEKIRQATLKAIAREFKTLNTAIHEKLFGDIAFNIPLEVLGDVLNNRVFQNTEITRKVGLSKVDAQNEDSVMEIISGIWRNIFQKWFDARHTRRFGFGIIFGFDIKYLTPSGRDRTEMGCRLWEDKEAVFGQL